MKAIKVFGLFFCGLFFSFLGIFFYFIGEAMKYLLERCNKVNDFCINRFYKITGISKDKIGLKDLNEL